MEEFKIHKIAEHPELKDTAARWFHEKWGMPKKEYAESMDECLKKTSSVPQWYVVMDGNDIVGGLGVVENDFHDRRDLTPNVCSVYVERDYRNIGIAGQMLQYACDDMKERGISKLYLLTSLESFYERYEWEFYCMVQGDDEDKMSRMYIHK